VVSTSVALGVPECPCGWLCVAVDGPEATARLPHCFWGCAVAEGTMMAVAAALPTKKVATSSESLTLVMGDADPFLTIVAAR
jgi:hypothetical protein